MAENGGLETAKGYVRIYFGGGKGASTGIRQGGEVGGWEEVD